MTRTSFAKWPCPIARTIDIVGDGWTMLVLRESFFFNARRFGDFQDSLGIPSNVLANRLLMLVEEGILAKAPVGSGRSAHEYRPTSKGADLWGLFASLLSWGNRWTTGADLAEFALLHRDCGGAVNGERCLRCDKRLSLEQVVIDRDAFLRIGIEYLRRCGKDGFAAERDVVRARAMIRKLERNGCLDAAAILRACRDGGVPQTGIRQLDDMLTDCAPA
jgi:DNA-binding HxlR family transcriptional regulator